MLLFDPFNMSLTLSSLDAACFVFIDAATSPCVDALPNLLRLKRDVRVTFLRFGSRDDVVRRNVECLFPRAGVVIVHHDVLLRCTAGLYAVFVTALF